MVKQLITLILSVCIALGSVSPLLADKACPEHANLAIQDQQSFEINEQHARNHRESAALAHEQQQRASALANKQLQAVHISSTFTPADDELLRGGCLNAYSAAADYNTGRSACADLLKKFIEDRHKARVAESEKQKDRDSRVLGPVMTRVVEEAAQMQGLTAHDTAKAKYLDSQLVQANRLPKPAPDSLAPAQHQPVPSVMQHEHQHRHTGIVSLKVPQTAISGLVAPSSSGTISGALFAKLEKFAKWAKQDTEFKKNAAMGLGGMALVGGLLATKRSFCYRNFNRPNFFGWTPRFFPRKPVVTSTPSGIPPK